MRIDVIGRDQQAGGDGQAGAAEAESHRIDMGDVDAGQLRAQLFLRHRADGPADIGEGHDQPQHQRDREYDDKANQRGTARK